MGDQRKRLRVAEAPPNTPLTVEEVQETGNDIAKRIRKGILTALYESTSVGPAGAFNATYNAYNIRTIRNQARQAIDAWQQVEADATELLDQANRMGRGGS